MNINYGDLVIIPLEFAPLGTLLVETDKIFRVNSKKEAKMRENET